MIFSSNSTHKIDGKGRVSIPAGFRKVLEQEPQPGVVLAPDVRGDDAIEGFGYSRLEQMVDAIEEMPPLEDETMALAHALIGEAKHLQLDENGRIVLSAEIKAWARLEDQALFIGLGRRFQIWNPDIYAARRAAMRDRARANLHRIPRARPAEAS